MKCWSGPDILQGRGEVGAELSPWVGVIPQGSSSTIAHPAQVTPMLTAPPGREAALLCLAPFCPASPSQLPCCLNTRKEIWNTSSWVLCEVTTTLSMLAAEIWSLKCFTQTNRHGFPSCGCRLLPELSIHRCINSLLWRRGRFTNKRGLFSFFFSLGFFQVAVWERGQAAACPQTPWARGSPYGSSTFPRRIAVRAPTDLFWGACGVQSVSSVCTSASWLGGNLNSFLARNILGWIYCSSAWSLTQ